MVSVHEKKVHTLSLEPTAERLLATGSRHHPGLNSDQGG